MRVLSLFDGMSCGQIALRDLDMVPDVYYASEIDKFAIAQTQLNFPDTIQLGNVTEVDGTKLGHIDLLLGGSPCQSFSFAGKRAGMATIDKEEIHTLGKYLQLKKGGFRFEGQSYLFWEYMRILNELRKTNPNVLFLLENVEMGKKWEKILSDAIGLRGVHINSALVSAQNRKRIYWTNIRTRLDGLFGTPVSDIPQPADRNIFLEDILQEEVEEKYYVSDTVLKRMKRRNYSSPLINPKKTGTLNTKKQFGTNVIGQWNYPYKKHKRKETTKPKKSSRLEVDSHGHGDMGLICVSMRGRNLENPSDRSKGCPTEQRFEPDTTGKTNCLTTVAKDNLIYQIEHNTQIPDTDMFCSGQNNLLSQTNGMAFSKRPIQLNPIKESNGNQPYQQNRVYDVKGISPAVMANMSCGSYAIQEKERVRRLTPTECARLQTIPQWYKWECSETQQYKMLGNGWTVEIIKHILSFLKNFSATTKNNLR